MVIKSIKLITNYEQGIRYNDLYMVVNQGNTSVYSDVTEFTGSSTEFTFANLRLLNEPFTIYFTDTYGSDMPVIMHGMMVPASTEFGTSIITDTEIEEPSVCLLLEITYESDEITNPVDIRRHVFDTDIHITTEERDIWNKKISPEDLVSGDINEIKINDATIADTTNVATTLTTTNTLLVESPRLSIKNVLVSKESQDAIYQGEDNKQGITLGSYGTPLYIKGTPVSLSYLVNGVEQDSRIMTKADLNVAVSNAVTDVSRYRYEVKTTVPDPANANTSTIYLVPSTTYTGYYEQYIKVQEETTPGVYVDVMKNVGLISAIQGEKGERGEDGYTLVAVSDFTENDGEQNVIALCPQQYTLNAGKVVYGLSFELGNDVSVVVDNDPLYVIISDEDGNPFAISTDTFDPTYANSLAKVRFKDGFLIPENGKFIISFSPSATLPNSIAQMPQRTICVRTCQNPSADNNAYIITEGTLSDPDASRTRLEHSFAITYHFIYDKELSNLSVILNQTIPQLRKDIEINRVNINSTDINLENHINDSSKHLNETTIGVIMRRMVDTEYNPNSENAISSKAISKVVDQLGPMKIEQLYPYTAEYTDNTLYYYKETGAGDDTVTPTTLILDDTMMITSSVGDNVVTKVNLTIETEGTDHFTVSWPKNIIWNKKPESPLLNYTTYDISIKKIKTPTGNDLLLADVNDYYDSNSGKIIEVPAGHYLLADVRRKGYDGDTGTINGSTMRNWAMVSDRGRDYQPTRINLENSFLDNKIIFVGDVAANAEGTEEFNGTILASGNLDEITQGYSLFYNCVEITESPVLNNVWNANSMFTNCKKLVKSNVNHSSITTCANMYDGCTSLEKVEGDFDNITSATSLFSDCENLKEIPTNFPKLRSGIEMFKGCYKLSAEQLAEVLTTISDVSDITSGSTGITFPLKCAESNDTKLYLEANYPAAIAAATAKNWTINYR